ncbi:MAG: thioredoxin family protein [Ignavibacteriae bacterium]|nr:thioredoxin family protein [Ignavibacteriota bacterium]
MLIFIEPNCRACERVMETAEVLRKQNIIANFVTFNRNVNPESCMKFGVFIFPTVYINGRLAFYGEFTIEDLDRFLNTKKSK